MLEMANLRPECSTTTAPAIPDADALYMIRDSVRKRGALIHGRLHDGKGNHCAIGAFFTDNPDAALHSSLIDEVAAYNDSIPATASAKTRKRKVLQFLNFKLRVLAGGRV